MADMTPERLNEIEARYNAAAPHFGCAGAGKRAEILMFSGHSRIDVPNLIAEVRRLTTERDAAAEEARALRVALAHAVDFIGDVGGRVDEDGWAAYGAPPTVHVKLARVRKRVCEAARDMLAHDTAPDMTGVYLRQPNLRGSRLRLDALWAACDALAEAEREAGVTVDG